MASSSPALSSSPTTGRHSSPVPGLAFLVHSPNTVANSLPPEVDNKPLARQKRRRTSKEDEEILKAEYLKNPKPDKAARMEIVSKVALGEKEVQIWFQNKRQNDRRRSRPLDPSATHSLMSSSSTMSDSPTEDDLHASEESKSEKEEEQEKEQLGALQPDSAEAPPEPPKPLDDTVEETLTGEAGEAEEAAKGESQNTADLSTIPSTDPHTVDTAPTEPSASQQTLPSSQGAAPSRTSWISNRRSASFIRSSEDYAHETITFPSASQPGPAPPPTKRILKRAHSFVRISTNEDGSARIVTDLDKTPSPPHARTNAATFSRAAVGLRRSYSAAGLNDRLVAAAAEERSPKIPKTSANVGRSRDSRAWEFWCDPDSRYNTSLTTRAEQEGSGSAADAIGLIRSHRKVLTQNQARANSPGLGRHALSKVSNENRVKKSRGPMQRASTAYGRMQTKEQKKGSGSEYEELPQTESDKENWEPGVSQARRPRHLGTQRPRQILGENTEVMSQSTSLGAMLDRARGDNDGKTSDPEQDDELKSFMNGTNSAGRTTVSSAEEAGCVEGLLKLSQGQWR